MVECQAWIPLSFCTTANEGADFILDPRNFDAAVLDDQHADLHQLSVHSTLLDLRANNRDSIVSQPPESDHSYYAVNRGSPFYDTHAFDANGATLVHQCFQHKRFDLVKWMVHHFPTFSLEPYRSTYMNNELPCGGQNILHLAVRSKNYCMAKWLLEFYCGQADATMLSRLLMGGARVEMYGHRRDGLTPLQLAAMVKDNEDIKLLIDSYHSPVPLSFRKRQANPAVGHVGNPASAVTRTQTDGNIADVQGLNSRAANEHYCRQSTYYYLHTDNCTSIDRNEYIASSSLDPLCKPHKWDANGATILHQCFQHRKYELVKWIITKFPRFSLEPHLLNKIDATGNCTKLPYGGQNILHMAVLAKNHVMAKWILDFYSRLSDVMLHDLLTARVYTQSGYFDKKTVGGSECLANFSKDDAVCYRYSPTLEPCDDASIQMFGNGRVVKVCDDGTHVEVVWDAENTCGNLSVLGSYTDMSLTARLIRQNWDQFDEIIISRDCHRCNHISHKSYWRSKESDGVDDFQTITYMDILSGKFTPAQSEFAVGLKMPFAKFHRIIVDALAGSCS
jgi:ankyrin repeat protein